MSAFKYPRTSQPQGAAEIDWSNPSSEGFILNLDRKAQTSSALISGSTAHVITDYGTASLFSGTDGLRFNNNVLTSPCNQFTIISLIRLSAYPDSSNVYMSYIFGMDSDYTGLSFNIGNYNDPSKADKLSMQALLPGGGWVNATSTDSLSLENNYVVAGRFTGDSLACYIDGTKWLNSAFTPNSFNPYSIYSVGVRANANSRLFNGIIGNIFLWNRALSDAEIKYLSDNPWQLFKPQSRTLWIPGTVSAGGTTNAGIAQADGADTTALSVTVTTGAGIGNVDAADTQIITAANWTTAQLSGSIGSDTTTITATAGSVTNASVGQADSGDATAITAANWTTSQIIQSSAADTTSIATAVTTGAVIATFDSADTTTITGNIVGVTSASVAVTDAADAQAIATLVTTGVVIVGTDGADSALAAAACWTTAILGASDAWDVTGITGSVAPGTAIYPLAADVRLGITYGPTGADYVGTLTGGGPSAADIAAAVWSYTQ